MNPQKILFDGWLPVSGFRFPVLDDAHFFVLYYRRSSRRRNKKFKKNVRFVQCLVCNFESVYRRDILPPRRQSFFIPRVSAFGFFDISSHSLSHSLSLHLLIFISCSRFVTLIIIIMIIIIQNFVSWVFCLFFIVPPIVLSIKRCATHFVVFRIFFFFFFLIICPAFITLVTNEYTRWKVAFLCL